MSDNKETKQDWAPEPIWLQRGVGDEGTHTWCSDSQDEHEQAEYVRVDVQAPAGTLNRDAIQQKAFDYGFRYCPAPDGHGVIATSAQAVDLLQDLLVVEVEIKERAPPVEAESHPWVRHGSGEFEWWSDGGYEARKSSGGQWVLTFNGMELYRHTFLQVVMAYAKDREDAIMNSDEPTVEAGARDEIAQKAFDRGLKAGNEQAVSQQQCIQNLQDAIDDLRAALARASEAISQDERAPIDRKMVIFLAEKHGVPFEDAGEQRMLDERIIEFALDVAARASEAGARDERAAFEEFAKGKFNLALLKGDGDLFYERENTDSAWKGWQARANLEKK